MVRALVISGPTASGKSALTLKVAQKKNGVIINADSLQIYEGLPLLSSQPSEAEKKIAPHLLYSHFKSHEFCSVAIWLKLVREAVDKALEQNKLPIIVGGTGMYISKIFEGISQIPEISAAVKVQANVLYDELGRENFRQKLLEIGEKEILDKQRLLRAYEVFLQTEKTLSWWQNQPNVKLFEDIEFMHINLNPAREELYQNCNLRFERMLGEGAIEEVEKLQKSGVQDDWQITKTLGFVEISDFLDGKISRQRMIELATQKTRNYAKRQVTWFRNQFAENQMKSFSDADAALRCIDDLLR